MLSRNKSKNIKSNVDRDGIITDILETTNVSPRQYWLLGRIIVLVLTAVCVLSCFVFSVSTSGKINGHNDENEFERVIIKMTEAPSFKHKSTYETDSFGLLPLKKDAIRSQEQALFLNKPLFSLDNNKGKQDSSFVSQSELIWSSNYTVIGNPTDGDFQRHRNESCVRIVVPFTAKEVRHLFQYLSWWYDGNVKGSTRLPNLIPCTHLHLMMDKASFDANITKIEMDKTLKDAVGILWTAINKMPRYVTRFSFSVFTNGHSSYHIGSYRAVKYAVLESSSLGYKCMFLMETDICPIRSGWLDQVQQMCFNEGTFLIKGSSFRDTVNYAPWYGHINGNCIWSVGNLSILSETFEILDYTEALLENLKTGYDVLIDYIFVKPWNETHVWGGENMEEVKSLVRYEMFEKWNSSYIDSSFLVNKYPIARPACSSMSSYKKAEERAKHKNAYFIHCRRRRTAAKSRKYQNHRYNRTDDLLYLQSTTFSRKEKNVTSIVKSSAQRIHEKKREKMLAIHGPKSMFSKRKIPIYPL